MALKNPIMPSPTAGLSSSFSPYSESPNSPAPFANTFPLPSSNRSSAPSDSLAPPASPYPQNVDPSPVDSNGSHKTESTDIEDDAQEGVRSPVPHTNGELQSPDIEITSPESATSDRIHRIDTQLPDSIRLGDADDGPSSVIHAPPGFRSFEDSKSDKLSPSTDRSENTVVSPESPGLVHGEKPAVSPVNTDVPRFMDRSTPRAQTRQELDDDWKRRSRRKSSLEDIPEAIDKDDDKTKSPNDEPVGQSAEAKEVVPITTTDEVLDEHTTEGLDDDAPSTAGLAGDAAFAQAMQFSLETAEGEVAALRTALSECWTLCNTLAGLSSSHRQRTFQFAGKQKQQEEAWRNCWRLCQKLYDNRDEDHTLQVVPTLELCRDFCQSLFEARQKVDEASDSVLRVSFELNNHLYNTHDRDLPEAFNERTLDFYITLCHRLMKQRTSLPHETDALLRACWSLAEMLFNLRQNKREGKLPDEELLGSAIQSCWELCDLFRDGWTQIRPDRGTPRPSQTSFPSRSSVALNNSPPSRTETRQSRSDTRSNSSTLSSNRQYHDTHSLPPETPTTIFDDVNSATSSPDSVSVPNILVLGPASGGGGGGGSLRAGAGGHLERWSSNASVLSGYSESASSIRSGGSGSTATAGGEDAHLLRLRYLLLRAGAHTGYARASGQPLPVFVAALPQNAFGTLPWQMKVLSFYRKLVTNDKSMMTVHTLPPRKVGAAEMAKSVKWLGQGEQWAWMRDLYRLVFGFGIDDAERRGGGFQV